MEQAVQVVMLCVWVLTLWTTGRWLCRLSHKRPKGRTIATVTTEIAWWGSKHPKGMVLSAGGTEVAKEVGWYNEAPVTVMAPPVKRATMGTGAIEIGLRDRADHYSAEWLASPMHRLAEDISRWSDANRRAGFAVEGFARAARASDIAKPEQVGHPGDFVYSMGRRRRLGGWRLHAWLRRLAWAAGLAGVGGVWWMTR